MTERILPKGLLGYWVASRPEIWQMNFLDQGRFASFCKDRGVWLIFGEDVELLWQVGLLKADLVTAPFDFQLDGLVAHASEHDSHKLYSDERTVAVSEGLSEFGASLPRLPDEVALNYHPFRYLVAQWITSPQRIRIGVDQHVVDAQEYVDQHQRWQAGLEDSTSRTELAAKLDQWEAITELAIATEPVFYQELFQIIRMPSRFSEQQIRDGIASHWDKLKPHLLAIGIDEIENARNSIVWRALMLDSNKEVHTLLRLTSGERRINGIKDDLGGAMVLLTMAEMLRRATEKAHGIELPEEDEMGFARVYPKAKEQLYGSTRVTDDRSASQVFMRSHGLDFGVRVRWYFEGITELTAVESALGQLPAFELIDLHGRFVQGGGKGLSFSENLLNDIKHKYFSFISLDGDVSVNARAVRRAAERDEFFGMIFRTDPDFEFTNFTLSELEDIIWSIALEEGAEETNRSVLHGALQGVSSAKQLMSAAQRSVPELAHLGKGREWGESLMAYAQRHPFKLDHSTNPQQLRPVLEAINQALHAIRSNYDSSRTNFRVDPVTGRPLERQTDHA